METIWAPWRIDYIKGEKEEGCIFCNKPKENDDRKNLILYRGSTGFIIMNRYPYSHGHLIAVPYSHISEMSELSSEEKLELMNLSTLSMEILKPMNTEGFNVGLNLGRAGGVEIDEHIQFYIILKWRVDTQFMAVI